MVQEQTEKVGQIAKPYKTFISQDLIPNQPKDSTRRFLALPKISERQRSSSSNLLRVLSDIRNKIFTGFNLEQ